jgi:uncharacterized protein
MRALQEVGVRSPLAEAGFTKPEIRALAQALGLPNWNKPAAPCLATRFPYDTLLTREEIARVGKAEAFLHSLGFASVRVRVNQDLARIETDPGDFTALIAQREHITDILRQLGYLYIALDLVGYRTGSMNAALGDDLTNLSSSSTHPDREGNDHA